MSNQNNKMQITENINNNENPNSFRNFVLEKPAEKKMKKKLIIQKIQIQKNSSLFIFLLL